MHLYLPADGRVAFEALLNKVRPKDHADVLRALLRMAGSANVAAQCASSRIQIRTGDHSYISKYYPDWATTVLILN